MIKRIDLQGTENARRIIGEMIARGRNIRPLQVDISEIIHDEVTANFLAGGRDPEWPESERVKKFGGETLIDKGILVASIQAFIDGSSAGVATNNAYAAIHNFGGDIERKPYSSTTRLRTDAKGNLLRQGSEGLKANLAIFAKSSHKRTRDYFRFSMGYRIHMPQREFMKISGEGIGKIEAAAAVFLTGG
jgi:phage gpG-like protein